MIIEHRENLKSDFDGTIIDIETIGEFCNFYDSRRCLEIRMVAFGFINKSSLQIFCANGIESIGELKTKFLETIDKLDRPYYAFNCSFESSVWFHQTGKKIIFDGELQARKYERKSDAISVLNIPNYDDPFFDQGLKCMQAWHKGKYHEAVAHNRACLLKEKDILLKRKTIEPEKLNFVNVT